MCQNIIDVSRRKEALRRGSTRNLLEDMGKFQARPSSNDAGASVRNETVRDNIGNVGTYIARIIEDEAEQPEKYMAQL